MSADRMKFELNPEEIVILLAQALVDRHGIKLAKNVQFDAYVQDNIFNGGVISFEPEKYSIKESK